LFDILSVAYFTMQSIAIRRVHNVEW
jgi:hypothetical protein